MSEISDTLAQYEERLVTALSRIQSGIAKWPDAVAEPAVAEPMEAVAAPVMEDAGEIASLKEALEEERTANAQLEKRVKHIRSRQQAKVAALEEEVEALRQKLADAEKTATDMRRSSEEARQALQALQGSAQDGMAEPHLVNKAMMAELTSLRAERAADAAEINDIITAIEAAKKEGVQNA